MQNLDALQLSIKAHPCASCGTNEFELLATHDRHLLGLRTVGCKNCGLLQTNPRPTKESLDDFYVRHYRKFYQGVTSPSEQYIARYKKDSRLRYTVDFLQRSMRLAPQTTLLDYGCGEGSLFVALRQSGFDGELAGVEPNAAFARFAAENARAVVHAHLDRFEHFDNVVINHVLEHISDPIALLRSIASRLRPNGEVYVDVPDAEEYAHAGDLHIAHIFHFTERTLTRLFQAAGYAVRLCERHHPPNHPRSVRLIAGLATAHSPLLPTSPTTEAAAWARARMIERTAWKWVIRKRLANMKLLRSAYRRIRAVRGVANKSGQGTPG